MKSALSVLRGTAVLPCGAEELSVSRMKFVCDRCQTRYSIADDKVRQKILRIRCKTCGNVILVQESAAVPETGAGGSDPHLPQKAVPSSRPKLPPVQAKAASGPKLPPKVSTGTTPEPRVPSAVPGKAASGPKVPPIPPGKSASGPKPPPTESQKARVTPPPPPPAVAVPHDPLGGRVEWYVAVDGKQSGPFSRSEAAKRVLAIDPGKSVHVWKEGMAVWKPASEVSVIAREINLLRPMPPPPPRPASPPTPPPAMPSLAGGVQGEPAPSSHESAQAAPPFPGGSPVPPSEPAHAAASAPDEDVFLEATTGKNQRIVEAVTAPPSASFTDATTKKGKNLYRLESETPSVAVADNPEDQRTPPPVHPLPPVVARPSDIVTPRPVLGEPPTLPNPLPLAHLDSGPSITFDLDEKAGATPAPSAAGGFSEVVAAMAAVSPPGPSALIGEVVPVVGMAPVAAFPDFAVKKSRLAELFERQPGMKYVVAALALVVLVLLLVMVILRGNASRVPEVSKEPAAEPAAEPAGQPAAEPVRQPAPEEVAKPDEPKPPPKQVTVEAIGGPRPRSGSRSGSRHGSGRTRPAVERQVTPKQPSKPTGRTPRGDVPRPNPFGENLKAVSQSQISAVVRNSANQAALRSCYERALKMDNHLTSGRMDVTVSVSASGAVQRVVVNAPSNFILVQPCIKSAVRRWRFPAGSEDYGTNFPLILQGGM
jgi:predicted Zn finger-like uncharacterized protein